MIGKTYTGTEQWLINLNELRARKNMTYKQIAEGIGVSEKTVSRTFLGEGKNPGFSLVKNIITFLGGSLTEIFEETGAVIGGKDTVILQAEVDRLAADNLHLTAELAAQKEKVASLQSESDLLRLKLEHKDELISLHNFYKTVIGNMRQQ